jgi:hypothetical protein
LIGRGVAAMIVMLEVPARDSRVEELRSRYKPALPPS